jgi:soluble lytic murein transglycosylase-like protein
MQLTPSTARMLGVSDSFDPGQNIEGGVKYLKYLQGVYKDDRLALAAYNAGPGAVEKYKSIPPYPETQNYVNQVGREYNAARQAAAANPPEPAVNPEPQPPEEKHPKLEQYVDQDGRLHLRTVQ